MRILSDCGSTSCKWVIENRGERITGPGINPSVMSETERRHAFEGNERLFADFPKAEVTRVDFFGTGCLDARTKAIVGDWLKILFPNAAIQVESDLFGACLAVYTQGQRTAVGILGTGSAAAGFDGTHIVRLTPSLGYLLADEGAGSDIGRRILTAYLYHEMPPEIAARFEALFPDNTQPEKVIQTFYGDSVGSAYLARHTQLAAEFAEHSFMQALLDEAFQSFIRRHMKPLLLAGYTQAGLVGSVASGFRSRLTPLLLQAGFEGVHIVQDPLDALPQKVWTARP